MITIDGKKATAKELARVVFLSHITNWDGGDFDDDDREKLTEREYDEVCRQVNKFIDRAYARAMKKTKATP